MNNASIIWKGNVVPFSEKYDDYYYSSEDGLGESKAVFLKGIDAPHTWKDKITFIIAEQGFGTGLNFLNTAKLWLETSEPHQTLTYFSTEKYPLLSEEINKAIHWNELFLYKDELLNFYPEKKCSLFDGRVKLNLLLGDSLSELRQINRKVDAWYLDGFAPKKSPDMWSVALFKEMARLSKTKAKIATFTAAGHVRRGLAEVGFEMSKRKGYGKKREMLSGIYKGNK